MPELVGERAADHGKRNDGGPRGHHGPRFPAFAERPGYGRHASVDEDVDRHHERRAPAAPAEFVQDFREEDGKRVPDAVDEETGDDADCNDHPAVKEGGLFV